MAGFNQSYQPYQFGYNNGYNNMGQGFQTNNMFNSQQVNNGIIWVQGIEGAKAYQLNPNSNVILLDSESDRFYIKTSDNIGMCNLRTFNFNEITNDVNSGNIKQTQQDFDLSNYVTRDEFQEALKSIRGGKQNGKQFVQSNEPAK